ncbi:hypothetical protein DRO64_09170 [Candidatus Bathyarchaeota archaeon]|nr:MAG: hypothetical protein DRN46_05280 [Thermococci archaeon]RLI40336.1 MAG: hypothetical protein DRO64_09170 [Candidatus Bathyarchaeota archaeon]
MDPEEAKGLVGRYICVKVKHTPENAERLGRRFDEICGEVLRIEQEGEHYWLLFDWGWGVRLDAVNEWWEEASEE